MSGHGDSDSSNFTTTDKLYLLSTKEVWGDRGTNIPMYDTAEAETRQLDYYSNIGVSINKVSGAKKYDSSGSIDFWWLRSVDSRNSKNFVTVYLTGNWNTRNATDTYGVAPAFRLS